MKFYEKKIPWDVFYNQLTRWTRNDISPYLIFQIIVNLNINKYWMYVQGISEKPLSLVAA